MESLLYNPPAFKPGSEHIFFKRLIEEFEEGDIVITVPEPSYRCPPVPYEGVVPIASMIKKVKSQRAYVLHRRQRKINSEFRRFLSAYYDLYKDVATYVTYAHVKEMDVHKKVVKTTHGDFKYTIANIIPPMKASNLLDRSVEKRTKIGIRGSLYL